MPYSVADLEPVPIRSLWAAVDGGFVARLDRQADETWLVTIQPGSPAPLGAIDGTVFDRVSDVRDAIDAYTGSRVFIRRNRGYRLADGYTRLKSYKSGPLRSPHRRWRWEGHDVPGGEYPTRSAAVAALNRYRDPR